MEDLTLKILKLLKEESVEPEQMNPILLRVADDIQFKLWEKVNVSYTLLYNLKDTIWFNLEHIPSGGEPKGMSNLRNLGKIFPTLAYSANNSEYVQHTDIEKLLNELLIISSKWSNEWSLVQLISKSEEGWNGGEVNPSPIVIYNTNESPSKYGVKKQTFNNFLLDSKGDIIQYQEQETVHCVIEEKLGTYGKEPLMRQLLEKIIESCKKALANNKGLLFDFQSYDYNN